MAKIKDLTNQRFGRLIAKKVAGKDKAGHTLWYCDCDCNTKDYIVAATHLLSGNTKSCGCLHKEVISNISHRKYNDYDLSGEYGIGWASNTNEEFYFDLEDYDKIKDYCWDIGEYKNNGYKYKTVYTRDEKTGRTIKLHKLVVDYDVVDHSSRNTLDNRKCNLREATYSQNAMNKKIRTDNKSGIIGVRIRKDDGKWSASISINKKRKVVYHGDSFEDAVRERLKAEKQYYGEFAPQKHLYEEYNIV